MRLLLSSVALVSFSLCGCGAGAVPAVQAHAASEMKCDAGRLSLTRDKPEVNAFTVEGCGQIARYWTICNAGGYCPHVQGQVVSGLLAKQAAFDLKCAESDVTLSSLSSETFAARGCGHQASYVLVGCDRGACKVVQNTQSQ